MFDAIRARFLEKFNGKGGRGAVYFDPQADEPYLFYLARIPIVRHTDTGLHTLDEMLVGIKRFADGRCEETPAHLLLTLMPRTAQQSMPATLSFEWINRADETQPVKKFVSENFGHPKLSGIRNDLQSELESQKEQIKISFNARKGNFLNNVSNSRRMLLKVSLQHRRN